MLPQHKQCPKYSQSISDYKELIRTTFRTRLRAYFCSSVAQQMESSIKSDAEKKAKFAKDIIDAQTAFDLYIAETHKESYAISEQFEVEYFKSGELIRELDKAAAKLNLQKMIVRKKEAELKDLGRCRFVVNKIFNFEEFSCERYMNVLKELEEDCLTLITYKEEKIVPMEMYLDSERNTNKIADDLEIDVKRTKAAIVEQEMALKKMKEEALNFLNEFLNMFVIDRASINIHVGIEDMYRRFIPDATVAVPLLEMLKAVDVFIRNALAETATLPVDMMKALRSRFAREEEQKMNEAYAAEKSYKQVLELARAMGAPIVPKRRITQRFRPPKSCIRIVRKRSDLTPYQREYLEFFTDVRTELQYSDQFRLLFPNFQELHSQK